MEDDFGIPSVFHSEYTMQPFDACVDCGVELLHSGRLHIVQKAIVAEETVFEMAMCLECVSRLNDEYSQQSRDAIQSFMEEQLPEPADSLAAANGQTSKIAAADVDPLANLAACGCCGKSRDACHRYCIGGLFAAGLGSLAPSATRLRFPLMICDDCSLRMNELISQQTRDRWNRFVEEHFDGPPGIDLDSPRPEFVFV